MPDDYSHIPSQLVTVKAASEILTANGDKTSAENLRRYAHRHNLVESRLGRSLLVNPSRLAEHRDNFTREVMRGDHLKDNGPRPSASKASKKSPASKTAKSPAAKKPRAKSAAKPRPALTLAADNPSPKTETLDRARVAKAEKEEAQADTARLNLYKQTRDLISVAEFETLLGLLTTLLKEAFFGVNLSDDTDAILAVNNLPDARKKPTQNILKARRKTTIAAFAATCEREMARLDPDHTTGYALRFKKLIAEIHSLREQDFSQMLGGGSPDAPTSKAAP